MHNTVRPHHLANNNSLSIELKTNLYILFQQQTTPLWKAPNLSLTSKYNTIPLATKANLLMLGQWQTLLSHNINIPFIRPMLISQPWDKKKALLLRLIN